MIRSLEGASFAEIVTRCGASSLQFGRQRRAALLVTQICPCAILELHCQVGCTTMPRHFMIFRDTTFEQELCFSVSFMKPPRGWDPWGKNLMKSLELGKRNPADEEEGALLAAASKVLVGVRSCLGMPGRCGQSWKEASDPDFIYNPQQRQPSQHRNTYYDATTTTRGNQQWVQQPRRPSRRRNQGNNAQQRQPSQRSKGKGKGQARGQGPRVEANQAIAMPAPQQDPPWTMSAPAMPMMPAPPPPPVLSNAPDPQTAELIAAVSKNPDACSPEVQAAYHALQARNAQKESKILHSAVSHLTKAKQELADAQLHRSNMHSSWIKFLQDSVAKWQECGKQFRDQEEAAITRIKAAQSLYTSACDTLNRTKKEAGVTNAEEVVDVEEMDLTGVSTVNSAKISESLANLQTTLTELHQSAEELAAQESHTAKRPRIEPTEQNPSPDGLPAFAGSNSQQAKSPAMEPFGMPGQKPLIHVQQARSKGFTPSSILLRPHSKRGVPKLHFPQLVQFADQIDVKICDESFTQVQEFCCSHASFRNWAFKPWSLHPGSEHSRLPVNLPDDSFSSLSHSLGISSFENQTVPDVPLSNMVLCDPLSEEAVSISRQISVLVNECDSSQTDGRVEDHPSSPPTLKESHVGQTVPACPYRWNINAFFETAVAENERPYDAGGSPPPDSQLPGESAASSDPVGHSSRPPVPVVPPFAREVSAAFAQRLRSYVPTDVSGPWIRVWYIHLEYHVRSFFARHVQLRGPPHTWREQVVTLWQDVMLPDVESSIDLVTPTPPREAHEIELVCDVILAQGIGGRHVAGLVTARPMDPSTGPRPYSGAVAFGAAVSQNDIISGLALDQICRQRQCLVRHGRTVFSQTALHQMYPGHGFLIDVGHPRSVAAGPALTVDSKTDRLLPASQIFHHAGNEPADQLVQAKQIKLDQATQHVQSHVHLASFNNAGDPLSLEAVSISHCWHPFQVISSALGAKLFKLRHFGTSQAKLTDPTEPGGDLPDRTPEALRPVTPQNAPIQPIVLPAFIHDMCLDLPEEFLDANIFQRGFLVRTWYIHHCTIRRSRVSRCIHLRGPPITWQAQILTVWFDVLIPHEAVAIDVVKPRPPRNRHETRLAFDLILSQGLELDRYAGLITVNPSVHTQQIPRYAMAVSFPPETNGQMIVDFLAFQQVCRTFQCFIVHRWDQLPISPLPVHVMQPGDGFVVGVFTRIPEPDDVQTPSAPSGSSVTQQAHGPVPMQCDTPEGTDEESSQRDASSSVDEPSEATDSLRRNVHLYRLGQPVVSVVVNWPLPNDFISVVAPVLRVFEWDIVALHPVQVIPEGASPLDLSFIVQMANDLPLGTTDQLLLCDVRVHQHGPLGIGTAPVVPDRRVSILPIALQRVQILIHAHLAEYCQLVRNRCLVKLNGQLWPLQDESFRQVSHGAYVQIFVPPPRSTIANVLRAIQIVEDFGFTQPGDGVADRCPDWGLPPLDSPETSDGAHDTGPVDATSVQVGPKSAKLVGSVSVSDQHPIFTLEHANDEQTYDPPALTQNVGTMPILPDPVPIPLPPIPDLQAFLSTFSATVDQFAEEEFEGQGPVVQIVTWYIHHGRYTECTRHHIVELDANPATWPSSLCAPWTDVISPTEPLALREVLPGPPRHHYQRHAAHVIIEQGLQFDRYASHFSILVQGSYHDAMLQKAYSTPTSVSAEDLLTLAGMRERCRVYRCTAWSGIMQFDPVVQEQIFSGISIKLNVHGPKYRHRLLDFGDQPFWHPPAPGSEAAASSRDSPHPVVPSSRVPDPVLSEASDTDPHFDGLFRPDLQTAWHVFLAQAPGPPYLFRVYTWFCDHIRLPRSNAGRLVTLSIEPDTWRPTLAAAWSDWLLPGLAAQHYVVQPAPLSTVNEVVAHVIIAQNQLPDFISVLISTTIPEENPWDASPRVVKLPRIVDHWMLVHEGGLMMHCPPCVENRRCQSWIGPTQILPDALRPSFSGDGFYVAAESPETQDLTVFPSTLHRIDRLFGSLGELLSALVQHVCAATSVISDSKDHSTEYCQVSHSRSYSDGPTVPSPKVQLCLDDLVPVITPSEGPDHLIPLKLRHLGPSTNLPTEIFLEDGFSCEEVERELSNWGSQRHVYMLASTGLAVTVPFDWHIELPTQHLIYCPCQSQISDDVIFHTTTRTLTDLDHMRFLHSFGFLRVVILQKKRLRPGLVLILYHNNIPELESVKHDGKVPTPWPAPQPIQAHVPMLDFAQLSPAKPSHCLHLGIHLDALASFFLSPVDTLCPWYSHMELPDFVRQGIDNCVHHEGIVPKLDQFDRLIIYTDGSSKAHERRQPPLKVADHGTPDAWAYVVLGEKYATSAQQGSVTFLGWQTQQVMYEMDNRAFTGTDQIGAEFAEREALLFAGLWRLALNSTIPTIFRTDSSTTADQAAGRAGFANLHPTHELLRGTFQALQAGMSPDTMIVDHVRGHAGDVWNEFVDFLAKTEASVGHHLKRQDIDLAVLRPCIPYMWMLIARDAGLPLLTAHGFAAVPPQLPPVAPSVDASVTPSMSSSRVGQFTLSLASLNVCSLSVGPDGFGGKLSYLRNQMLAHGLNILGVQEARSPPGLSMVDQVLRISGGSDSGKFGVELWISLRQPYVYIAGKAFYFARSDFQLLHHDPRRLLVRMACAHLDGFLMVLHAPQSGRPQQERETWWRDTTDLAQKYCQSFPLFVLMDANAKTGRHCEPIVFHHDDVESSSTPFLRDFLTTQKLCLPSTSEIHTSEHSTWTAPNGSDDHRIDFVAIPQTFLPKCSWSSTVPSLDPGHAHVDHVAVAIQLAWNESCRHTRTRSVSIRHDRHAIRAQRNHIDFSNVHVSKWQDDIEAHVTSLNSSLHTALAGACPFLPAGPKKPFIDDDTWALRTEKLQLRRSIKSVAHHKAFDCLAYFFKAWSGLSDRVSIDAVVFDEAWNHQATVLCSELCLVSRYWATSRKLRKNLQLARNVSLTRAIHDVGSEAAAGTILHTLRPFLGSTNPKKQKKACLPIVRQSDGTLCQTPEEAQNRWIAHFGDMEGGTRLSHAEYRSHWRAGLSDFLARACTDVQVQDLPSLFDLEIAFRRVPSGKALGLDGIPPELCHYCPAHMAKVTYAVVMKAVLFGQEAMEHKGGKLAVAWKQKGDVRDCHTHRSLLVSSHLGKTVHRALRQKYNHLYNAFMQRHQLGGRPFMPFAVPLHMTRAFLRWKHRCKHPTALVFLDLTEAFYRTLRPLAVGGAMSDECIGRMCHRLNLAPETMQELALLLSQPSALSEAGAPAHVQLLLQALHRDTWFQMGTQTDLVRTEIGSRPGDSFADVVFGYLWAKILKGVEATLIQHEVLEHVVDLELPTPYEYVHPSLHPGIPLLGPTWMDDLNIVLTATSNAALVSKTQFALSVLIDTCKQHHMEPNLKKGKTEVMFTFCGSQSRAYRRQYYSQDPGLPVVCDTSTVQIAVVSRYLHLGGVIHHRDATNQEIQRRLAIAHQAYQQHRRILYHNRALPWRTRCDLFQTLVLSKLMYGVESWTFSTQQCRNRIHAGVMKLYRKLLGGSVSTPMTDLEVLVKTNLPDPTELLRRARLRYFGTLHRCRHQAHWGLLQEDHTWIELLKDDLFWLWCQLDGTSELQDPREHFPQWQDLIVHHGGYWKKLVRRGIRHACLQRQKEFHAIELHDRIGRLLLDEAWISHIPCHLTIAVPSDPAQVFGCMSCQMSSASYAGESVHMCRSHGRIARERFLFDATHCPSCLKEYHTHSKVLAHLRHSRHCKDVLISRRMNCQPVPGPGSTRDHTLQAQTDGALPFLQAYGPHLPPLPLRQEDTHDLAFLEAFYMFLLDVSSEDSLLETCRHFILSYPISWTACCRTLHHMRETITADDAEPFDFSRDDLLEVLSHLTQHVCWPFLADDNRRPVKIQHATLYEWEVWCSDLAECPPPQWSTLQPLPQTLTRYKIILHAFAGRRRRGDIEWFIDSLSHQCSGFTILTVSLDIIIDSHHGDISKAEVRVFWLQYIRRGYVAGFIAGPPCNTWSRARAVKLSDRPGPRVIRTPSEPWGLQTLRLGELEHIILGTVLHGFSLECLLALALHSGSGLIEHPRASEDEQAVSIWKLPIVHMLLRIPQIRLIHLAQGLFGAPSPKPTSLLVLRLPELEKCLHGGMIAKDLPYGVTTGRDSSGNFNTAPLKEYPPGLCRAIAEGFVKEFTTSGISVDHDAIEAIPTEFFDLCQHMRDRSFGDYIGPSLRPSHRSQPQRDGLANLKPPVKSQDMKITPRLVMQFHKTFKRLKQYDSITLRVGPHEVSSLSMTRLVKNHRKWVAKIMILLLDLAGFKETVTWDGFLYVTMQFCALSKLELCQVMFYVVCKEMKSWTVHYLTSSQLEEFYDDYYSCPVAAFNTQTIDFAKVPLAKYRMQEPGTAGLDASGDSGRYELFFLMNMLSLQQSLPSLRFWSDYDTVKVTNMLELMQRHAGRGLGPIQQHRLTMNESFAVVENSSPGFKDDAWRNDGDIDKFRNHVLKAMDLCRPAECGVLPLPTLGVRPPEKVKLIREMRLPKWMHTHLEANEAPGRRDGVVWV
eukprot:s1431_g8.t1